MGVRRGRGHRTVTTVCPRPVAWHAGHLVLVQGSAALQRQTEGNSGKSNISNEGAWGINLPEKIKGAKSMQLC